MKKTLLITIALLATFISQANTITVTNTNDSGVGSLRQAAIAVVSGDTIRFDPSLISVGNNTITLTTGEIDFGTKGITIKGLYTSTDTLFISGNNNSRIFSFNGAGKIVLDSLVLINGNGIGAYSSGNGGAVMVYNCSNTLNIYNSIFKANTANLGGGIYSSADFGNSYSVTIINSTFSGNTGGGFYTSGNSSNVTVTNSTFSGNTGGGIYSSGISSYVTVTNSTFSENTVGGNGGGIISRSTSSNSSVVVNNSTFSENTANLGGGIYCLSLVSSVYITVNYSTFSANKATNSGGAIYCDAGLGTKSAVIKNSTFTNNTAGTNGAAIYASPITIGGSIIAENGAGLSGIYNINGGVNSITSNGYNIFSDAPVGATTNNGDLLNISAAQLKLSALQNNGGTTKTIIPYFGSVALNAGNPGDTSDAQNNPIIGIRDIGAAEKPNTTYGTDNIAGCSSYTWSNGITYYTNNNTATYTTIYNATDSHVATLNLTINYPTSSTFNITANECAGYTLPSGDSTYTTVGTYTVNDTIHNVGGCDSVMTITITVNAIIDQTVTAQSTTFCSTGDSTTIDVGSSETGVNYYLRDDASNTIIDGPIAGTGSAISFNTGNITTNMTYNVNAVATTSGGLKFEGGDEVVKLGPSSIQGLTNFTFETWVYYPSGGTSAYYEMFGKSFVNSFNIWHAGGDKVWLHLGNGTSWFNSGQVTSDSSIPTDVWTHIAVTWEEATHTVKIYINGVLDKTATHTQGGVGMGAMGSNSNIRGLGGYGDGTDNFRGTVDDFRVWTTVRTEQEIFDNMNDCMDVNESGLLAYYKMDEAAGSTTVSDATGNGNDGILNNMDPTTDWITGKLSCSYNCEAEMTQTVTVSIVTVDASVTTSSTTLTSNETGATYQWLDCNNNMSVISNETNQSFTATVNGSYAVAITKNGCTDTSACFNINSVGVNNYQSLSNSINIYPNPATNNLNIELEKSKINSITIINITGEIVKTITENTNTIDVSNLSNGIYYIQIYTDNGLVSKKFVKE